MDQKGLKKKCPAHIMAVQPASSYLKKDEKVWQNDACNICHIFQV